MRTPWTRAAILGCMVLLLINLPGKVRAGTEFSPGTPLKYYTTDHFRILYHSEEAAEAAPAVGAMAEEVRTQVQTFLGAELDVRYDIVLLDNFDYANGSASGFPRQVIRLYLTPPSPPIGGLGSISDSVGTNWMRDVFVHEYTHAVQLNHLTGWPKYWAWAFHATPFYAIYPGWFTEGLAVAVETGLSPRGRANIRSTDMFLRTAVLEERLLSLGQWSAMTGWPRGGAAYLYGGNFLYYVSRRFGSDGLMRIVEATNRTVPYLDDLRFGVLGDLARGFGLSGKRLGGLRVGGLERGFQRGVGIPLSELERDWRRLLQARYFAQAHDIVAAGVTQTRPLTRGGGRTRAPAASPNGRFVAFIQGGDSERPGVALIALESGEERLLSLRNGVNSQLAWLPDSSALVYTRLYDKNQPLARVTSWGDLFLLDIATGRETRLTHDGRLTDPAVAPDGSILAIQTLGGRTRLVEVSSDGGTLKTLYEPDPRAVLSSPAVAPDGKTLILSVMVQQPAEGQARYTIASIRRDGSGFRLRRTPGTAMTPVWLDETHVVYSDDRSGVYNLYVRDLETGRDGALTNVLTGALKPTVIPGSPRRLAFRLLGGDGYDIHLLEPNAEELAVLEGTDRGAGRPVPDVTPLSPSLAPLDPMASSARMVAYEAERRVAPPGRLKPLPEASPRDTSNYRPLYGLKLAGIRPVIALDEGVAGTYGGGVALGASASAADILGRHRFYAQVAYGLTSAAPTYLAAYTNASLAFPISVHAYEAAFLLGAQQGDGDALALLWERQRSQGLEVTLPWRRGLFWTYAGLGGGVGRYRQYSALAPEFGSGTLVSTSQALSGGWATSNTWRTTDGIFYGVGATQEWLTPEDEAVEPSVRWELTGSTLLRRGLGRGTVDLDLQAGVRRGQEYAYAIGGFEGAWALPGIAFSDGLSGVSAAVAQLRLIQDLWQPEWSLGQVPWFHLKRVQAVLNLGSGTTLNDTWQTTGMGYSAAFSLRARCFSLRKGFSFSPQLTVATNLETGAISYWLTLDGWPGLYSSLIPVRMPSFQNAVLAEQGRFDR